MPRLDPQRINAQLDEVAPSIAIDVSHGHVDVADGLDAQGYRAVHQHALPVLVDPQAWRASIAGEVLAMQEVLVSVAVHVSAICAKATAGHIEAHLRGRHEVSALVAEEAIGCRQRILTLWLVGDEHLRIGVLVKTDEGDAPSPSERVGQSQRAADQSAVLEARSQRQLVSTDR